jgi:hypothetical protein
MATIDDFSLPARLFLKTYRWRRVDPVPWTPLHRPLAESRLALISSAGFILPARSPSMSIWPAATAAAGRSLSIRTSPLSPTPTTALASITAG